MLRDDLTGNIKSQTGVAFAGRARLYPTSAAEISFENVGNILLRDAVSLIADCDQDLSARNAVIIIRCRYMHHFLVGVGNAGNRDIPARRCMADRIADEVGDDLLDPLRIDDDHSIWNDIDFSRHRMPGCRDVEFSLLDQLLHDEGMRLVFRGIFAAAKGHARRRLCRRKRESRKGKGLLNFCLNFNKKGTELRTFFRILVK